MLELIQKADILHEALPYIRRFRGRTFIVKYGGSAMTDPELRDGFARDVVLLKYVGIHPVVVHGGGPQIDGALREKGIEPRRVEGLRVTDDRTMEVVEAVLGGTINDEIVSLIKRQGGRPVGMKDLPRSLLAAERLPERKSASGEWIDIGRVGRITDVRTEILEDMIASDCVPVVASLAVGPDGRSLNINADTCAGRIAAAMRAEKLVLMTDREGVVDAKGELIDSLTAAEIERLRDGGVITGGMIPKVECGLDAVKAGVRKCHIIDGRIRHAVLLEIFTDRGIGTEIVGESL